MGISTFSVACLFVALGLNPTDDVAVDEVDLIEINHFHDEQGKPVFDQIIFYDWSAADSRYQVRAWRMLKTPAQIPRKNWRDGGYVAVWHDTQNGDVLRKVKSQSFRESWTQYDPELIEREFLPKEKRRDLKRSPTSPTHYQALRQKLGIAEVAAAAAP